MENRLIEILKKISGYNGTIDPEEDLDSYGYDSLLFMQLIVQVETEYGIEFDDEELLIENFMTLNRINTLLIKKGIEEPGK
ncbi:acyl carrier protein [Cytobacillus purgationiresistens]|uniref:Acyl carrier protein n=1 Tax=Cytobacillus purgationiresistens TaxID=863449 RepID=A0ABU0ANU8_9BACI|nr:acyl carrier protein [Cytobacillus purgationiresistens]MDQ0272967.1 acyl carrier protein [Cytobacillus purgationiresistens]